MRFVPRSEGDDGKKQQSPSGICANPWWALKNQKQEISPLFSERVPFFKRCVHAIMTESMRFLRSSL